MKFNEIKSHLARFRVGIAGAGGLGSNCAIALARTGVGTIVVADFDVVESVNLNRQYYFSDQEGMLKTEALKEIIYRINPGISVLTHCVELNKSNIPGVFAGCDIIVEALDSDEMKSMLTETILLKMPGIPVVVGSGLAGYGDTNALRSRKIDETLYLCGDETSASSDDLPPLAPRVGIVANMQANIVVEILMQKK